MAVFTTLDDLSMKETIRGSREKVIYGSPGIRVPVAEAIVEFAESYGIMRIGPKFHMTHSMLQLKTVQRRPLSNEGRGLLLFGIGF